MRSKESRWSSRDDGEAVKVREMLSINMIEMILSFREGRNGG
jgi:hypothetical protein